METIDRKKAAMDFIYGDNLPYFDEAWDMLEKRCPEAMKVGMANHPKTVGTDDIFAIPIDKVISLLQSLKDEGYESISEQYNCFGGICSLQANKMEHETAYEYGRRVGEQVNREIKYIKNRNKDRENKQKELEKALETVAELKKALRKS